MNKNIKQTIFLISIIALLLLFLWFSVYKCPLLFFFWHSMPFLWNDQSIFMPIKRWSYNSLLLSSSLACSIGNFYYFSSLEIPASSLIGQMDRSLGVCDWNSVLALLYHKACNTFSHCTDWFYKRYFSFLFIYEYMKKEL